MPHFTKNKSTGKYDVIGLANEMRVGDVVVTKKDGTETTVSVRKVSRTFLAKFGAYKGQQCRIGTIQTNPVKRRYHYDEDNECELCGQNKYECGHCIGW